MTRIPTISTIDCHYSAPGHAAAYLIAEPGHAAFVDNNTSKSLPYLLEGLSAAGLRGDEVEFLIVTHVHLDHCAGTAALLAHCPNATVLCDPRAVRHLVDPKRLVASSKQVYGEHAFQQLYGEVEPVPAARVRSVADGEPIALGTRTLTFLHTEGHARHHVCIHDSASDSVFTGDSFGIAMQTGDDAYVMCTSTPTDFDAEQARISARRILDTGASAAHVTHYGTIANMSAAYEQLVDSIDRLDRVLEEAIPRTEAGGDLIAWCQQRVAATMAEHAYRYVPQRAERARDWFDKDYWLNAMGLAYVAERRRKRAGVNGGAPTERGE